MSIEAEAEAIQPRCRPGARATALVLLLASCWTPAVLPGSELPLEADLVVPQPPIDAKIYVQGPGVFAVPRAEIGAALPKITDPARPADLEVELSYCGEALPVWHSTDGAELRFLVSTRLYESPCRPDGGALMTLAARRRKALRLRDSTLDEVSSPSGFDVESNSGEPVARRRRHYEQDLVRAPVDKAASEGGVSSMWYWTMISHQASSRLEIELGLLPDLDPSAAAEVRVRARLLGWSQPKKRIPGPELADHQVDLLLGEETIGSVTWNGRNLHTADLPIPPRLLKVEGPRRLRLKVPARDSTGSPPSGTEDPLIDLVYVDAVELSYRLETPSPAGSPLWVVGGEAPREWVVGGSDRAMAVADRLGVLPRQEGGGVLLPAASEGVEIWLVEPEHLRRPVAVAPAEPVAVPGPDPTLDYLMIAPRSLVASTRRLAELHRRRGLNVAVVEVEGVLDLFGGERDPGSIARYIDLRLRRSPRLRYVLLVGDADWTWPRRSTPGEDALAGLVPTFTHRSDYGPAPSDHGFVADPDDEVVPRAAIGRLPVADATELDGVIDALARGLASPRSQPFSVLMLADGSDTGLWRQEVLARRLGDSGVVLDVLDLLSEEDASLPDDRVVAAFGREPAVVHFGGHGGRYQWQLGRASIGGSHEHFDLDDVRRLPETGRLPVVLSISCATAPFDHPAATSLGETFVVQGRASAFLGAGVRLFTPRELSRELVLAMAREETVGDAVVAAKRATGRRHVSYIYNLLGDPATPLR